MSKYDGVIITIEIGEASVDNETWDTLYSSALETLEKTFPGADVKLQRAEAWNGGLFHVKSDNLTLELENEIHGEYEYVKDDLWN